MGCFITPLSTQMISRYARHIAETPLADVSAVVSLLQSKLRAIIFSADICTMNRDKLCNSSKSSARSS